MNKEFIQYNIAIELKQLGFDEPCFGYYEPNGELDYIENHILKDFPYLAKNSEWQDLVAAPTFSQAFRWFRENHDLNCYIDRGGAKGVYHAFVGNSEHGFLYGNNGNSPSEFTYEEAELACLKKLIEIVKQQDNEK
jgi:hypothetical protein